MSGVLHIYIYIPPKFGVLNEYAANVDCMRCPDPVTASANYVQGTSGTLSTLLMQLVSVRHCGRDIHALGPST